MGSPTWPLLLKQNPPHLIYLNDLRNIYDRSINYNNFISTSSIQVETIFLMKGLSSFCTQLKYEGAAWYLSSDASKFCRTRSSLRSTGSSYARFVESTSQHSRSILALILRLLIQVRYFTEKKVRLFGCSHFL